jgi:hypothetical protein
MWQKTCVGRWWARRRQKNDERVQQRSERGASEGERERKGQLAGERDKRNEGERMNRGTAWGARKDSTKWKRASLESDKDHPPPTRARGGTKGGYCRRSNAVTGANRVGLGTRQPVHQMTTSQVRDAMEEEREEEGVMAVREVEVGVRMGVEEGAARWRNPQPAKPVVLALLFLIAQSIVGKIDELCCVAADLKPDLF